MDILIVKGDFIYRYRNNATCIAFSIKGNVINIEESD